MVAHTWACRGLGAATVPDGQCEALVFGLAVHPGHLEHARSSPRSTGTTSATNPCIGAPSIASPQSAHSASTSPGSDAIQRRPGSPAKVPIVSLSAAGTATT